MDTDKCSKSEKAASGFICFAHKKETSSDKSAKMPHRATFTRDDVV